MMVRELQIRYRNADGRADAGSLFSFSSARLIAFFPQISPSSPARTRERHKSFLNRARPLGVFRASFGTIRPLLTKPRRRSSVRPSARGIDQIWQQSDVLTGEKALARNAIRTERRRRGKKGRAKRQSEVASESRQRTNEQRRGESLSNFPPSVRSVRSFFPVVARSLENTPTS